MGNENAERIYAIWPRGSRTPKGVKPAHPRSLSVSDYNPEAPEIKGYQKIKPEETLILTNEDSGIEWIFWYHSKRRIEVIKKVRGAEVSRWTDEINHVAPQIYFLLYDKQDKSKGGVFVVNEGCHWAWLYNRNGELSCTVRQRKKIMERNKR